MQDTRIPGNYTLSHHVSFSSMKKRRETARDILLKVKLINCALLGFLPPEIQTGHEEANKLKTLMKAVYTCTA